MSFKLGKVYFKSIRDLTICWVLALQFIISGCGLNPYARWSDQETDAARYEEALKSIDRQDWDAALAMFELLGDDYKNRTDVIENWSGAHAGKCGIDFMTVFTSIGSGQPLLKAAMNAFTGRDIDVASCHAARAKMEELGSSPFQRNASQNLFMLVLGMGHAGAYLRRDADIDGSNNLGDGSMDVGFDACANHELPFPAGSPPASDLADGLFSVNELNQIIMGFGLIINNFAAISAEVGGTEGDALAEINDACDAISPNPCTLSDPSLIDDQARFTFAAIIHSGPDTTELKLGIGSCSGSLPTCCGQ